MNGFTSLAMLRLCRNLTESQISELIEVLTDLRFKTRHVPKSLAEYKRLKKYTLPTLKHETFLRNYKDNDGKVRKQFQPPVCRNFCLQEAVMKYYAVKPLNYIARELIEHGSTFEFDAGPTARSKNLWKSKAVAELREVWAPSLAKGAPLCHAISNAYLLQARNLFCRHSGVMSLVSATFMA